MGRKDVPHTCFHLLNINVFSAESALVNPANAYNSHFLVEAGCKVNHVDLFFYLFCEHCNIGTPVSWLLFMVFQLCQCIAG